MLPVIILDTCALLFDALTPDKLSASARRAIEDGEENGLLACSDISLWEIAMLIQKGRLDPGTDGLSFITLVLESRNIRVLPITPEIAYVSASYPGFDHHDPADRIIGATTLSHKGKLVTSDSRLQGIAELSTIW